MKSRIIILGLVIVLLTNLAYASFAEDTTKKVLCKKGGPAENYCELYKTIINQQAKITSEVLGALPQGVRDSIIDAQDPRSAAYTEMLKALPAEVNAMINNVQEVEGYLKDIESDPDKEKIDSEYTDEGELILRDKDNNVIGKIPKGFETIKGEKGELIFVNKEADRKSTLQLGEFKVFGAQKNTEIKITETKDTKSIFINKGSADLKIGNKNYKSIANAEFRMRKIIDKKTETTEVEYASFFSRTNKRYDFKYRGKTYSFASQPGSHILFNPTAKELSIASTGILIETKEGLKCRDCGAIEIGDSSLVCAGCSVMLNNKLDIAETTITKGIFSDKENKIKVNGDKFKVCLSPYSVEEFDQVKGCEGENTFWFSKDEGLSTNIIKTNGKLDYSVGFTDVSTTVNSETKFIQAPDLRNIVQVTKGKAEINKDGIKSTVSYIQCNKGLGAVVGFFIVYEGKSCGTIIKLERKSISSKITEDLYVKSIEKNDIYNIDSKGNIVIRDKDDNIKFGEIDPDSSFIKENLAALYGQNFASQEGSVVAIGDGMNEYLKTINLEPSILDKLSIFDIKGKKKDAQEQVNLLKERVNKFSNLVYEGYPVDAAIIESELDKEETKTISLFFKKGINNNGAINYENIPKLVNNAKKSCSGNTYSEIACLKSADFISGLYRQKIIKEEYKGVPKSLTPYISGNPSVDLGKLNILATSPTGEKLSGDIEEANGILREILNEKRNDKEFKEFIKADKDLRETKFLKEIKAIGMENFDYLIVLGVAPKAIKYGIKGIRITKKAGRMEGYINAIKDTRYLATLKTIREGKSAKALIKNEDLPNIVRECL